MRIIIPFRSRVPSLPLLLHATLGGLENERFGGPAHEKNRKEANGTEPARRQERFRLAWATLSGPRQLLICVALLTIRLFVTEQGACSPISFHHPVHTKHRMTILCETACIPFHPPKSSPSRLAVPRTNNSIHAYRMSMLIVDSRSQ